MKVGGTRKRLPPLPLPSFPPSRPLQPCRVAPPVRSYSKRQISQRSATNQINKNVPHDIGRSSRYGSGQSGPVWDGTIRYCTARHHPARTSCAPALLSSELVCCRCWRAGGHGLAGDLPPPHPPRHRHGRPRSCPSGGHLFYRFAVYVRVGSRRSSELDVHKRK